MPDIFTIDSIPQFVGGAEDYRRTVSNGGPGTLYYDNERTVSPASNDGSIAPNASQTFATPTWLAASTDTWVIVSDPLDEDSAELATHEADTTSVHGIDNTADVTVVKEAPLNVKYAAYGALGDDSNDDTAEIQAALDAAETSGGGQVYAPPGIYRAGGLSIADGVTLFGEGPATVLKRITDDTLILSDEDSNVTIRDLAVNGQSTTVGTTGAAVQIRGNGRVLNLDINDAPLVAIQGGPNATDLLIEGCRVGTILASTSSTDHAIRVITADDGATYAERVIIRGCIVRDAGMAAFAGGAQEYILEGNIAYTPTEDGFAVYGGTDTTNNHRISLIGNRVHSPTQHGCHIGGDNALVVGNTFEDCGSRGILMATGPNTGATAKTGFQISGNIVDGSVSNAIQVVAYSQGVISGNTIKGSGSGGVLLTDTVTSGASTGVFDTAITGNTIQGSAGHGISFVKGARATINGNIVQGGATRGVSLAADVADAVVADNYIEGNAAEGVAIISTATRCHVWNNSIRNNGTNISFSTSNASACTVRDNLTDTTATVASAAALALPHGVPFVTVSGSTTITSISNPERHVGRTVVLFFSSSAQVTDGNNLKIAGDFTGATDRTLTLRSDGTNFYELSRSSN